jgi:hypothetical protein
LLISGSAAKVRITERQQEVLRDLATGRSREVRLTQRATVILRAFDGLDNRTIAQHTGLGPNAVGLWRRRWQKAWPRLILVECAQTKADLRRAIAAVYLEQDSRVARERATALLNAEAPGTPVDFIVTGVLRSG